MFFLATAILEFFQLFYSYFNLAHYAREKLSIYDDNLLRLCKNLALR